MGILRQWFGQPEQGSGSLAKDRLRLVLVHNRLDMSADTVEELRHEMLVLLSRYFDVDHESFILDVQRNKRDSQLVTSITLKGKRSR